MSATATTVTAPDGSVAVVQTIGAQVTSWIPAGGAEQFFVGSRASVGERAVKGGIPVLFPQFADLGPLPNHGFARDLPWAAAGETTVAGVRRARFVLEEAGWGSRWPHAFKIDLEFALGGPRLALTLTVHNTGTRTWYFTGGLHTYIAVSDIGAVRLDGLEGHTYRDKTRGGSEYSQSDASLTVSGETDRVYLGAPDTLVLREPGREVTVSKAGFPDVVVWNPWEQAEGRFPDFGPGDFRRMLCVEAVAIGAPPTLEPGMQWSGTQTLTWSGT